MSEQTKTVIEPDRVQEVLAEPTNLAPPVPSKRPVFHFVKTMSPMQVITLRSGEKITFRVPRTNSTGGYASAGTFETEDDRLAQQIRNVAKNPALYIFEAKQRA